MTDGGAYLVGSSTGRQCEALTKSGKRCASYAVDGSRFCYWHCPELAADRKRARSDGGRARHGRKLTTSGADLVGLRSVSDVVVVLEGAMRDLLTLENSVSRARACGYLCGQAVRALEVADLEERLARLEELVGVANGQGV